VQQPAPDSGDHFKRGQDNIPVVEANVPARQAVTGHNVRVVLLYSLLGAVIAMVAVYVFEVL
jgi:hypothetical protein